MSDAMKQVAELATLMADWFDGKDLSADTAGALRAIAARCAPQPAIALPEACWSNDLYQSCI
jgi:hypothetical protein